MVIRQYRSSDLECCRSLWTEMVQRHRKIYNDTSIGGEDPGLEFDAHLSKVGPDHIWIAVSGDDVIGMVALIMDEQQAEIEPIVVSSKHRGKGIGYKLVDHVIEQARLKGILCLSVKPVARNEAAISFFHRTGFRTLGHIQLFMWLDRSSPGQWKSGPRLFGKSFNY